MRSTPVLGCLALVLVGAAVSAARAQVFDAVVQVETAARCRPSDNPAYYPTNRLHVGDRVRVVKERDDGWLEIQPPSGSFSWINTKYLETSVTTEPNAVVAAYPGDAPVNIGSTELSTRPPVEGVKLKRGYIVTRHGQDLKDADGTWMSIEPPREEVRYLRADVVRKLAPQAVPPADKVAAISGVAPPPAVAAPPNAAAEDANLLLRKAGEAEKWSPQDAIALYTRAAAVDPNHERSIWALNRANFLRQSQYNPAPGSLPPPSAAPDKVLASSAPSESRVYPLQADPPANPTVRLAPPYGTQPPSPTVEPRTQTPPWNAPQGDPANVHSSGPGRLRRAGRSLDNRPTYVLESNRGTPMLYVTAQQGLDLGLYVDHKVELFGPAIYNGELRANYMVVTRVQLLAEDR